MEHLQRSKYQASLFVSLLLFSSFVHLFQNKWFAKIKESTVSKRDSLKWLKLAGNKYKLMFTPRGGGGGIFHYRG